MARRFHMIFALLAGLCLLKPVDVHSVDAWTGHMGWRPYAATEYYQWKESIPQESDFLTESGARYALGLAYSNFTNLHRGVLIEIDGKIYNGSVAYVGNAFDLTEAAPELKPFRTSTRYFGNTLQLHTGYRFPFPRGVMLRAVDARFSLGSDFWQRDIGSGFLADGSPVQGYQETYHVLYAKAGIGLLLQTGTHGHNIDMGIKLPLRTRETIDFSALGATVDLRPRALVSYYASWLIYPILPGSSAFSLSFYLEQTRFSKSDIETFSFRSGGQTYQSAIYQPDSEATVMGLRGFWEF